VRNRSNRLVDGNRSSIFRRAGSDSEEEPPGQNRQEQTDDADDDADASERQAESEFEQAAWNLHR